MTGIYAATATGESLDAIGDRLEHRTWYGREQFEDGDVGLGIVHHGEDRAGHATVDANGVRGVVYGGIGNLEAFGDERDVVDRLLADPVETLRSMDGPCAIAAVDVADGRVVAATDKIGSRPLYYAADDHPFAVGSQVKTVLERIDDVVLDERAVADLLLNGSVWGEKTLAEGVERLPPATVLEYEDGEVTTTRYWTPDINPESPSRSYLHELTNRYQQSADRLAGTMAGDVGIWLSGGLDSRSLAAGLSDVADDHPLSLSGFTYDSNPPSGGNPELASRIGTELGFPVSEVELTSADLHRALEEIMTVTDGMTRWANAMGVAAIYGLEESPPDVMLEACGQGELLGELMWRPYLTRTDSPVDALYRAEHNMSTEAVRSLLSTDVDPLGTIKREVARSDETGLLRTALDVHYRNHYSAGHFVTNMVTRCEADTRTQFADGALLSHLTRLPVEYRRDAVPFTDWTVPQSTTTPKLELVRMLDRSLASIPYERTQRPPSEPLAVHTGGYLANKGLSAVRDRLGFAPSNTAAEWYRSHDGIREMIDELLDGAAERSIFDADAVAELRQEHVSGEANNIGAISAVTTVEHWLRRHVDDGGSPSARESVLAKQ